jgi:3-phytase
LQLSTLALCSALGSVVGLAAFVPAAAAPTSVPSAVETDPVATPGDAADDPAVWVHPSDPSRSLVIGNNKLGALESYDLSGDRVQRITTGQRFWGNVDVRQSWVAVAHGGLVIYRMDPATRSMSLATEGGAIATSGEGLCLYDPGRNGPDDGLYAFTITRQEGRVRQYALTDADRDDQLDGRKVRDFTIGAEAEGCVADDSRGSLFIAEEDTALWRYGAEPGNGTARTRVDAVSAAMPADLEGVTLTDDLVLVSVQSTGQPTQSFVNAYSRQAPYRLQGSFRVTAGPRSDDCDGTDGIAAADLALGARFPAGLFVCQDGDNGAPGGSGNQNFKLVDLAAVVRAVG